MNTDGTVPSPVARIFLQRLSESTKRSRGSLADPNTKKRGSGVDVKEGNGGEWADRRGSSQRNSISISGMKTYREHAGAKMAAIAAVAREQMTAHQTDLADLFRYVVFLILFVLVVFLRFPQDTPLFWNDALRARFTPPASILDDIRISHINFDNVTSKSAFWLYMSNVLAPALEPDDPPNGFMRNALLGSIQLRQVRSEAQPCGFSVMVKDLHASCFGTSSWKVSKSDYGGSNNDMFSWIPQPQSNVNRYLLAPNSNFGTGGFVTYLSTSANTTRAALQDLQYNGWVDDHTRALFIDFTLQNPTETWLCMVRLLFEMPPYGGVRPSSYFRVTDVLLYDSVSDKVVSVIEALFVVFYLRIGMVTFKEIRRRGCHFFSSIWGPVDLFNMLVFAIIIFMTLGLRIALSTLHARLESDPYVDWQSAAYTKSQIYNLAAFNAVLSWFRVLKYLRLSKRLSMLERVLTNVRYELLAWVLLFLIIFAGFSQGFFLAFRDVELKYQTVLVSMTTLFQGVYGEIELHDLQSDASVLGPFLYIAYIFVVCFLMMSMFLAIVQGAWMKTEEDAHKDGQDDLAAALAFAISNAKDNAKKQGSKLKNLMVRKKPPPRSPRNVPKSPRNNPQQFHNEAKAPPAAPANLRRTQTFQALPRIFSKPT